jgi:hypothetical protein
MLSIVLKLSMALYLAEMIRLPYRNLLVECKSTKLIMTMVYTDNQNCWGSGLCPSSGILNTIKHNVSETGLFSVIG